MINTCGLLVNRGHVCTIRIHRDCDAVAKRFEFPPPSSLVLPLPSLSVETGGVCTRARRIVLGTFADWRLVRDYPNLPSVFLFPPSLVELQQVQFTSIGTKRMQK